MMKAINKLNMKSVISNKTLNTMATKTLYH